MGVDCIELLFFADEPDFLHKGNSMSHVFGLN